MAQLVGHGSSAGHWLRTTNESAVSGMRWCTPQALWGSENNPGHHEVEGATEVAVHALSDPLPDQGGWDKHNRIPMLTAPCRAAQKMHGLHGLFTEEGGGGSKK